MVFYGNGDKTMSNTNTFWRFASEACRQELGGDPLALLPGAVTVKTNAVRSVCRNGEIFLKLDRRARSSFRGEFNAACHFHCISYFLYRKHRIEPVDFCGIGQPDKCRVLRSGALGIDVRAFEMHAGDTAAAALVAFGDGSQRGGELSL